MKAVVPDNRVHAMLTVSNCYSVSAYSRSWPCFFPQHGHSIFCSACDCLGLRWTAAFPKSESAAVSIYVSRKADVARLDEFVGPKR